MKTRIISIFTLLILGICCVTACGANSDTGVRKYTVDKVLEKCGLAGCDEFSEDGNTWYYQEISQNGRKEIIIMEDDNPYKGYHFYIFKTGRKAKKELKRRKDSFFEEEEFVSGPNYAGGWEAGVMDASIKVFDYQSRNLIVEVRDEDIDAEAAGQDGWYEEYHSGEATLAREEAAVASHDKVMREW